MTLKNTMFIRGRENSVTVFLYAKQSQGINTPISTVTVNRPAKDPIGYQGGITQVRGGLIGRTGA